MIAGPLWPAQRDAWRTRWSLRHDAIRRALVGALRDGFDVAELLVSAAVAAEEQVAKDGGSLTDNRSGSWEASLRSQMLESGGAYVDDDGGAL